MLGRLLVALGLAAALVSGGTLAILKTDFVSNNLCAYAVATIEDATAAKVKVAACTVNPGAGQLTIDGLEVGAPDGRIHLTVVRVFVHLVVRPLLQRVRLERVEIDHPDLKLSLARQPAGPAQPQTGQCVPEILSRFELGRVKIRKARVLVEGEGGLRIDLPRLELRARGAGGPLRLAVATRAGGVDVAGRSAGLISSRIAAQVDLRGKGTLQLAKANLIGTDASLVVSGRIEDLCTPRTALTASLRTDDLAAFTRRFLPGVLHEVAGSASVDVTVNADKDSLHVKGDLRGRGLALEGIKPGDVRARFDLTPKRIAVDQLAIAMGPHGEVGGWVALDLSDPRLPLTADLTPKDMELAELLQKLGLPRSHVVLRSSGRVQAKGTLLPLQLEGSVALDLADFAVLDRRFEDRARAARVLEFPRGHLVSAVTVHGEEVALRNAVLDVGGSHLRVDGSLFTDLKRGLDLHAAGEGFLLEEFRGHIGTLPWKGRVTLDARIHGPYEDPAITSEASVRDLHFDDLALGDVSTQVAFRGLKLSFDQIEGLKERSSYAGAVALDFNDDRIPVDARVELLQAQLHDVVEMSVGLVPAFSVLRDRADVDGYLRGTLEVHGPVEAPDGFAKIEFGDVSLWGERFRGGQAALTLRGGGEPSLQIVELRLRHGAASVVFQGRVGPHWELSIDGRTEAFTLGEVDHGKPAQLQGPLSVTAQVRGVAAHPLVDLKIGFTGGTAGKALVGDGAIGIVVDGTDLSFRGKVGTHSFEGRGKLEGDFGYSSTVALRFPELSGYFATFAPDADLSGGSLSADVALRGSLLELQDSEGSISLTAMKLIKGDLAFENDGPGQLSFGPDGVSVQRLAVRAPYTSARISGVARRSLLDVRVEANVDGRILQGLVPDIEHATGAYLLHATLAGTPGAPSVLGNLRVENAEVRLSGLPLSFREMNGSVSFSQDALVIDDMGGKVNNGLARVSGGMEMKRLSPQRIDIAVHLSDVAARLHDNLSANLDGDLTLYGPPLEPTLGGNLTVSRMTYAEDVNIERSLLDFNRRPPSPRVLEKSQVLVHFDLGVHLARAVRIENNLARADLKGDLQVTGTSRRVGLLGSLNTVHGTAQFRGNEFVIDQGVLSFTDRQSIRPSFDLQASAQVKEYKVRLHAFGTPGEPHVTLVSDPVLAEADLGFLLTFGFVSQNLQQASFAAADSGLALGVEALNRFTGFSEEVRRFIPKNAILKDPNIDFTTDFSVASSRLEPMARFRSRVVTDRLDLRVLQGLATRRYRGVVSYQLTDLLSAQLQLDNEHVSQGTDFGADLKLHWEGGE